jgi:hypothetical protein
MAWALALGSALVVLSVWTAGALPWFSLREGSSAAATAKGANQSWSAIREAGFDALRTARIVGAFLCIAPPLVAFAAAYPLAVRARSISASSAAGSVGPLRVEHGRERRRQPARRLPRCRASAPPPLATLGGPGSRPRRPWSPRARPRSLVPPSCCAPARPAGDPGSGRTRRAGPSLPEVAAMSMWGHVPRALEGDMEVLGDVIGGTYPRPRDAPTPPSSCPRG